MATLSPIITGTQHSLTCLLISERTIISGPIPQGSPIVMAMIGFIRPPPAPAPNRAASAAAAPWSMDINDCLLTIPTCQGECPAADYVSPECAKWCEFQTTLEKMLLISPYLSRGGNQFLQRKLHNLVQTCAALGKMAICQAFERMR